MKIESPKTYTIPNKFINLYSTTVSNYDNTYINININQDYQCFQLSSPINFFYESIHNNKYQH
jgi:hypothetical protein